MIIMQGQPQLLEIVLALGTTCGFAGLLNGRKKAGRRRAIRVGLKELS